ncbi:hypothetical protein REPUB_Repub02eG0048600 [Reevesia pubescens]
MAVAVGRGFLVHPCSSSSSIFHNKIYKPSSGSASTFWSTSALSRYRQIAVQAQQRPTWLPGLDPLPYLGGTQSWSMLAFAMAGVAGILVTDLLRVTGISNLPVWYEAGAVKFEFASTRSLIVVQLLLMGYPGGPLLNPLGLAKDIKNAYEWKLKKIKNGRLAMIAMIGIFVQSLCDSCRSNR